VKFRTIVQVLILAVSVVSLAKAVPEPRIPKGQVLVELFEGVESKSEWPVNLGEPDASFVVPSFALFDLPQKYGPLGERLSYQAPILIRMTGQVALGDQAYTFLNRTNGKSRLWLDDQIISRGEAVAESPNAHGHMRPAAEPGLPYPRGRLGTKDLLTSVDAISGSHTVSLECLIGYRNKSVPVHELLVAYQQQLSDPWYLLSPETAHPTSLELVALWELKETQKSSFERLNQEQRDQALNQVSSYWNSRHKEARRYINSLSPIDGKVTGINFKAHNVIDQLLNARIVENNNSLGEKSGDHQFQEKVWPILEEHCIRCHGKKAKGGLKLDSHQAALAGGESEYATLVPGDAERSELVVRITAEDELDRMPSEADPLTQEQIAVLKDWIQSGAQWNHVTEFISTPAPLDELSFLRRIYLDTVGVPPSTNEIKRYRNDGRRDKKSRLIDRLLGDPRHADHWVPYWQDVLAENPSLMKPTLNNSGPFRYWIHESLLDNKPFDQFVTELVTFQGEAFAGGAGGFGLATDNDSPMAEKAHVVATAFLGIEMKCARCHDSPYHSTTQKELFSLAAMLAGKPLLVPDTSTVPITFFERLNGRKPIIQSNLEPGTSVEPSWPFAQIIDASPKDDQTFNNPAVDLAWQITRPENKRSAKVIVNRIWKRYFGKGFIEPAYDWEGNAASHPELLEYLAREFVVDGYDLKQLSRLILNSAAYARTSINPSSGDKRFFEAPQRRSMTAEQLVDSLFSSAGVPLFTEELTLDVEGHWDPETFVNYGFPKRAWEFVSTSTERERASLTLPMVNEIVSLMRAYGWRPNRAEPITDRDTETNVMQPGVLANSSLTLWVTGLSDYSELTTLAWEADSPEALVNELFLRFLTRLPMDHEKTEFKTLLEEGFDSRKTAKTDRFEKEKWIPDIREVSWGNHLSVEANYHVAAKVETFQQGPEPTKTLVADWRERMEDAAWLLINTPEFQFIP
jgi:hypothetical protein